MLSSTLYQIEKIVYDHKLNEKEEIKEPIERGYNGMLFYVWCDGMPLYVSSLDVAIYVEAAMAMPYVEALDHINYFKNNNMDEKDKILWIQGLCKQYDMDSYHVLMRLRGVEKLSKSKMFKKRIEELYGITCEVGKKLVKKEKKH